MSNGTEKYIQELDKANRELHRAVQASTELLREYTEAHRAFCRLEPYLQDIHSQFAANEAACEVNDYRPYTPAEAVQHLGRKCVYRGYVQQFIHVGLTHVLVSGDEGYTSYENLAKYYTWQDTGEPCGVRQRGMK